MGKKGADGITGFSQMIQRVFNKYADSLAAAYLFGSAATKEATPLSDIDIAVLFKAHAKENQSTLRFRLYTDLSRALHRNDIDLVILNTSTNLILQEEIVRNGVLLFDRDADAREDYECRILHMSIDFRGQRRLAMGT